jgi:dTDP-4-amino-4,6-dideoxygalactose transaminase
MTASPILFVDLAAQQARIKKQLAECMEAVMAHGQFIMGPEVAKLEAQLAAFSSVRHCLTCANGTEALLLVLMAKNIGPGDAVFVPSFTFAATAEVVAMLGATPVFVDVLPDTFNMDTESLDQAVAQAHQHKLKPSAVIPVDLFGQPADYRRLLPAAQRHGLFVLCDAAQSYGAQHHNNPVGTLGLATATSFFPTKPLGCYGDGGAVFTNDDELYQIMSSLRVHGKGKGKYDNVRIGMNSRLDTLQAAILLEKLAIFPQELAARERTAQRYSSQLSSRFTTPHVMPGLRSAWAQYTLTVASTEERGALQESLKRKNIPSMVYYAVPLHRQPAYAAFPTATGGALPVSESLASRVLSLPMHPYLSDDMADNIAAACLL